MVTTERNTSNVLGLSPIANTASSKEKSWSDCVDEFSSSLEANNAFCVDDESQYFVIKRSEEDFSKTSPFLISKLFILS